MSNYAKELAPVLSKLLDTAGVELFCGDTWVSIESDSYKDGLFIQVESKELDNGEFSDDTYTFTAYKNFLNSEDVPETDYSEAVYIFDLKLNYNRDIWERDVSEADVLRHIIDKMQNQKVEDFVPLMELTVHKMALSESENKEPLTAIDIVGKKFKIGDIVTDGVDSGQLTLIADKLLYGKYKYEVLTKDMAFKPLTNNNFIRKVGHNLLVDLTAQKHNEDSYTITFECVDGGKGLIDLEFSETGDSRDIQIEWHSKTPNSEKFVSDFKEMYNIADWLEENGAFAGSVKELANSVGHVSDKEMEDEIKKLSGDLTHSQELY
ncbi:MAG: hypothetical protein A3F91_09470 [Flavobacteria bacterium RIFCSPLOWO2_12_FULL_35_11]|nr:MAG: hypothetical protein A3F91_09470 [Flavobacteria bacterium RIFCSPLOWO2_12_FULL_35_11]